jgi:exopolysaccharide biosynthesis protein
MPKMAKAKPKRRIIIIILATIIGIPILLFYGPFPQFRKLWINTAMFSSRHQYLATALYTKKYIDKVLYIPFPSGQTNNEPLAETNTDTVNFGEINTNTVSLTNTDTVSLTNTDTVIFAEIKGDYFRGYIIKIEDPRRLSLVHAGNEEGKYLEDLVLAQNSLGGINGGGYRNDKKRGLPWGTLIADGEIVSACTEHREHTIGGLNSAHKLIVGRMTDNDITRQNFQWAFEFGPILIINGEKTALNVYSGGLSPRTAIGQTKEGHILMVVIDGRQTSSIGATFHDVQMVLFANGAINAIGLDGGASSCMVYQGELVNSPSEGKRGRLLPSAIVFK